MKKNKHISLVLITAVLASCHRPEKHPLVYIRSDSTAPYTGVDVHSAPGIWFYAFRPYGTVSYGGYTRIGYFSDAIGENSNIGLNATKSGIVRGGFGSSAGEDGFSLSS